MTRIDGSTIAIGNGVVLTSRPGSTALGVSHPTILRTLTAGAEIWIGDRTGISGAAICAAHRISIGERCLIGADVMIFDTNFHPMSASGRRDASIPDPQDDDAVVIGDDVFIGARSIVTKGSRIGHGSVIGAGSVVRGDIPPFSLAFGNPCKVVGQIDRLSKMSHRLSESPGAPDSFWSLPTSEANEAG